MIDVRLRQKSEIDACKSAAAALDTHARVGELDAWIARWWDEWEVQLPSGNDAIWPDAASDALRAARPFDDELSHAIEQWLLHREHDGSPQSSAALLVSRVIGRVVGAGVVSNDRFARAELGVVRRSYHGEAFFSSFAQAVPAGTAQAWIDELSAFSATLEACCDGRWSLPMAGELAALREDETRRIAAGEKASLWDHREPRGMIPSTGVVMRLRALFALSPGAALTALERIPSMALRHLCVRFLSISDDVDAQLRGVAEAPLLWDGDRWTGNSVAPLLIEAITKYATRLASAVERPVFPAVEDRAAVDRLQKEELPELFCRLTAALLNRADGRWLAIDYATRLLRKTSWSRNLQQTRVEQLLLDVLLPGLLAAGVRPADVRRLSRRRVPTDGGWARRAEFSSVAGFVAESATDARNAWAEFSELLVAAGDDDIVYVMESYLVGTLLFVGLGRALAGTASPRESWLSAWRELYPRRERSRFAVLAVKGLASSAYLALVGLSALHHLARKDLAAAKELWDEVSASLRCLASAPREDAIGLKMQQLVAIPWAFAKYVFGDDWVSRLDAAKDVFVADPVTCVFSADFLVKNSYPVRDVVNRMKETGCDPLVLGDEVSRWLEAKGFGTAVDDVDVALVLAELKAQYATD